MASSGRLCKLYEILKSLSFEYGEELSWLIPYPGDFHNANEVPESSNETIL